MSDIGGRRLELVSINTFFPRIEIDQFGRPQSFGDINRLYYPFSGRFENGSSGKRVLCALEKKKKKIQTTYNNIIVFRTGKRCRFRAFNGRKSNGNRLIFVLPQTGIAMTAGDSYLICFRTERTALFVKISVRVLMRFAVTVDRTIICQIGGVLRVPMIGPVPLIWFAVGGRS